MTSTNSAITPINNSIIFFDGVCNLCNASINIIIDNDPYKKFKFAPLQSQAAANYLVTFKLSDAELTTIILLDEGKVYTKSTAVLRIAKQLKGAWPLFFYSLFWIPAFIRDFFYRFIADNRYRFFGKKDECRIPTPELQERFLQ